MSGQELFMGSRCDIPSTGLYPRPNFFDGMGSVLNVFGRTRMINYSRTGPEADASAFARDRLVLGCHLSEAARQVFDQHAR